MTTTTMRTTTLLAMLALAACGSSGGGVIDAPSFSAEDQALRTFAADGGDYGTIFANGGTLSSRAGSAVGIQVFFDEGMTHLSDAQVSVSMNDSGELTASLNGDSRIFTLEDRLVEDDGSSFGYLFRASDGQSFELFHFGGTLEELLSNGNGFGTVVSVGGDIGPDGDTVFMRSFAAIGGETTDAFLAQTTGTATYDGFGRFDLYLADSGDDDSGPRNRLRGAVSMTADFDAGNISGTMDDLTLQRVGASERDDLAGEVNFDAAAFEVNTFVGSVSGNTDLAEAGLTLNDDAEYNGAFFGPNAEEVHGVVSGTGVLDGEDINVIGHFSQ